MKQPHTIIDGSPLVARFDHQPFATPDTTIWYRKGDQVTAVQVFEDKSVIIRRADGTVPTIVTSTGRVAKIRFALADFGPA